jgi:hypothetical protein
MVSGTSKTHLCTSPLGDKIQINNSTTKKKKEKEKEKKNQHVPLKRNS